MPVVASGPVDPAYAETGARQGSSGVGVNGNVYTKTPEILRTVAGALPGTTTPEATPQGLTRNVRRVVRRAPDPRTYFSDEISADPRRF